MNYQWTDRRSPSIRFPLATTYPEPPRADSPTHRPDPVPARRHRPGRGATLAWIALALWFLATTAGVAGAILISLSRALTQLSLRSDALVAGTMALFGLAWVASSGHCWARRRARADQLRRRRVAAYGTLIDLWGAAWYQFPESDKGRVDLDAFWPVEQQLALIGSAAVLNRYFALRDHGIQPGPEADLRFGRLIAAMRRDVLPDHKTVAPTTLARLANRSP